MWPALSFIWFQFFFAIVFLLRDCAKPLLGMYPEKNVREFIVFNKY